MTIVLNGEQLKIDGMEAVETSNPEFVSAMRLYALQYAAKYGEVSANELRTEARNRGICPEHPNAWGSVFNTPALVSCGFTTATTPSCHARIIRIWRLA
jgi:hypothetical protein